MRLTSSPLIIPQWPASEGWKTEEQSRCPEAQRQCRFGLMRSHENKTHLPAHENMPFKMKQVAWCFQNLCFSSLDGGISLALPSVFKSCLLLQRIFYLPILLTEKLSCFMWSMYQPPPWITLSWWRHSSRFLDWHCNHKLPAVILI